MKRPLSYIIVLLLAAACCAATDLHANGMNRTLPFTGLGVSAEYARSRHDNDIGCALSFKTGVFHIASLLFSADAGYRPLSRNAYGRIGGEFLLVFVGFEAGLLFSYRAPDEPRAYPAWLYREKLRGPFSTGCYLGLTGGVPTGNLGLFLSLGGNIYFLNRDHEFYAMASVLVNFRKL